MKKISIKKRVTFEAAHNLLDYDGACSRLHGHSWGLTVEISTTDSRIEWNNGMILDYKELKYLIDKYILQRLDHQNLNNIFDFNPTSEKIAEWIFNTLKQALDVEFAWIKLESISLKETENSECIIKEID
jgi:6-pyruvoyltetrahydropterin/6-carboxytetrahydropterin synthase